MPNISISTQQAKAPLTGTTGLLLSLAPAKIFMIEGYVSGGNAGTAVFLQILGVNPTAAVSGTTIPLWSRQITEVNGFSFTYNNDGLDTLNATSPSGGTLATTGANTLPLYMAISSTDTVWTSTAIATDVQVTLEQSFVPPTNAIVNTATNVVGINPVNDPGPSHRLVFFSATNNTGAVAYVMLFAVNVASAGQLPIQQWTVANGATINQYFGRDGIIVEAQGTNINGVVTDYTLHTGISINASTTTQYINGTANGFNFTTWIL